MSWDSIIISASILIAMFFIINAIYHAGQNIHQALMSVYSALNEIRKEMNKNKNG